MKARLDSVSTLIGRRVEIYRNLHKKCFSVRDAKTKIVLAHVQSATLMDCVFKVSEAGRQRVLREKRKNVHVLVVGTITEVGGDGCTAVSYNPYKTGTFVDIKDQSPVKTASVAVFDFPSVFAKVTG